MNVFEKPIPLQFHRQMQNTISLPRSNYNRLIATGIMPSKLAFGAKLVDAKVIPHDSSNGSCKLAYHLAKDLSIPFEANVRLFADEHVLHIGPLIGIFTAGFTSSRQRPVGDRSLMFAQYLSTALKTGGYVFIFGSHVIDWENGIISGYMYTQNGWQQHDIPFPHVVYDRIPNRKAEQLPMLQKIKKRMQTNYRIPWFNSGFFNKWTIYKKLSENSDVRHYLPKTAVNPTAETVEAMLEDYRHVYMKPADGSLGAGICHIIKREKDGLYYCRYLDDRKTVIKRYASLPTLFDQHFPSEKRTQFIVQQGISLLKINSRPVDFRIHTNKNLQGEWQISAIAAKISGSNRLTTHLANGGSVKTIDELLKDSPSIQPDIKNLQNTTLMLSQALEEKLDGFHGEFGFDMGIDINGRIWMFEANSKPGRAIFSHPKLKKEDIITRQLPFEFGTYLTETSINQPEKVLP